MTIEWRDVVGSVMDEAHQRAGEGAPHGTAIAARAQTAGRGQRGRVWASPEGGLWLAVIGRPSGPEPMEGVSVRVGQAVAHALQAACPWLPPITVKFPNDLLVGGRKLAGILCEARWEGPTPAWVIIGIGINVQNPVPPDLAAVAIRLMDLGPAPALEALAPAVAAAAASAALGQAAVPSPLRGR